MLLYLRKCSSLQGVIPHALGAVIRRQFSLETYDGSLAHFFTSLFVSEGLGGVQFQATVSLVAKLVKEVLHQFFLCSLCCAIAEVNVTTK